MTDGGERDENWVEELRRMRAEKNEFFAEHPQSPIPPDERETFDGLAYFEPEESFVLEATVRRHEDPETVELETSDGLSIEYRHVLTFEFTRDGREFDLRGYKQELSNPTIFVPFRDETTDETTYESGRYMELEPERKLGDGDRVTIDFNLAYTPFCAFSDTFSCPLAPAENELEFPVQAGEKVR